MARWKKQSPYEGPIHQGCLSCPPVEKLAPMDMIIAVGFGCAMVTCGRKVIFQERHNDDDFHTLAEFEEMARKDPNHSWEVLLDAPLRSRKYQRQGKDKWVLIESGEGFA